ncbi:MAG: hypothetical protein K8T20_15410 [Planctomycetes bacterium]|nr:hypothetical protein [Planctomycetota bacterium]
MLDALRKVAARLHLTGTETWEIVAIFAATFFGSIAVVAFLVVRMPADYFSSHRRPGRGGLIGAVLRNLIGIVLVLVGIVLSVPGVPGQGFLTILVGLMLTDIPGVRRMERALVKRPGVRKALDGVRKKFGKAPLEVE